MPITRPTLAAGFILLGCVTANADLVAHYGFDELPGSGDTVTDSLGESHGTLIGDGAITRDVTSPLGTGSDLDLQAGVDLGTAPAVRPTDQFTMTWWMRPDTLSGYDRIYESLAGTGNDGNGIRIDLGGGAGDSVRVLLRDGNGSTNTTDTHPLNFATDGTWYFVAVRYDSTLGDGDALKLTVLEKTATIDAAVITAATESPSSLGTGPIDLHANGAFLAADDAGASGSNDYGGGLDDFAIFQTGDVFGVLSDADLATVATIGALAFDPPDPKPAIVSFTAGSTAITSGASVMLDWTVTDTETLEVTPDIGNVDANTTGGTGSTLITPTATTVYTLTATNPEGSATSQVQITVDGQALPLTISEFLADNNGSFLDGDGLASDWIEIHNPNLDPLDIGGFFLTDDATNLTQWPFPAVTTIPGGGFLVVFASNQTVIDYLDAGSNLHTTFALKASGEYLGLIASNGTTVVSEFAPEYPPQPENISFGPEGFFLTPTPGAPNDGEGVIGFVADTAFNLDRGFYDQPIDVTVSTLTPDAEIYVTTDGSEPSPTNGALHTAPIPIATTTTLRAAAFKDGFAPTNVDTHTYIFADDVIAQPNNPPGYPAIWAGKPADYEMDPAIVTDPAYAGDMTAALKSFPTLSLVLNQDDMFGAQGIYQNPTSQGDAWERPVSAELIIPDASEPGFQIDAGIRIQGGSSRNPDTPKHSLSLRFRKEYGAGKLDYPMFADAPSGDTAVEKFDFLQLRCGYNFGWIHRHYYQSRHAQYNRDQWVNDLFLAMGQTGSHGRWVHLYINGIYWGVYHAHERPDADFMASYFGGPSDDYDALNAGSAKSGDKIAWDAMIAIAEGNIADPAEYANIQDYLDVDSLIDYILVNFYVGNRDWDGHNWRAARKREAGAGYKFFPWDSEFAISPNGAGVVTSPAPLTNALATDVSGKDTSNRPTGLHSDLTANAEYLMRFADRAHQHMFNGGPLSPAAADLTWRTRSVLMDDAIIAESARWGDFRRDVDAGRWQVSDFDLYTRNDHYLPDQAWILDTFIPQRTDVFLGQLRSRGLYPATDAPVFAQHGGSVPLDFPLTITNLNTGGTVYFTLDGTDPRDPNAGGSLISATATAYSGPAILTESATVNARVLNGSEWSALNSASFLAGTPANAGNLAVSEIMFNPAGTSEDTEFIELINLSSTDTIELGNAAFTTGIDFTFPPNTRLVPGARILVVANTAAFESVHGTGLPVAGEFTGSLDNDGEQLVLVDASDTVILDFTYNDAGHWPDAADGTGPSLVLQSPGISDPNDPLSWRDSTVAGGTPDTTDATTFTGDPNADNDHDGRTALLEHALGSSDSIPDPTDGPLSLTIAPDGHLNVAVRLSLLAADLTTQIEQSADLSSWTPIAAYELTTLTRHAANGTADFTYRSPTPTPAHLYLRLRVTQP